MSWSSRFPTWLVSLTLSLALLAGCPIEESDDDVSDDDVADDDTGDDDTNDEPAEPPWPDWTFHHWVWEDESTQESAVALVDGYIEHDIPVGAIIIDSPWATGYNTFEWDTDRYPDPQGMVDAFHDRDVRMFLWIVPAINVDVVDLYAEAEAAGYFMQYNEDSGPAVVEWWKGEGSLIDYWNPDAVAWWHALVDPVLDLGIDGWKCDGLDFGAVVGDYSPALEREVDRWEYSDAYYRDFFDYTREKLGDDRIITARPVDNYGADIGGQGVAFAPVDINWAGWVGDQDSDFLGLQAALRNIYWSADFGYTAFGSDIGGYRDDDSELGRDKEPFVRWAQFGALCPIMENGGGGEHRPWEFDTETADIYREFTNLHYSLLPYLNEHGAEAFAAGTSLMAFERDETFEYLLGPDIFVAPMIEEGTERVVPFPDEGTWVWLFGDHEAFEAGSEHTLEVPLDSFPVFVREGSEIATTLLAETD